MWEIAKNIRDDAELRQSFNELAKETFDLDFEDWYQNGFWTDNYIPYSVIVDGKVAANVSVNRTDMLWNGRRKHLIQLGTVMTRKFCRNQGMIRRLMEEIEKDFGREAEGIYLFANDSVLDFYPKFGFRRVEEYQYSKEVLIEEERTAQAVSMKNHEDWKRLVEAMKGSVPQGRFEMTDNPGLIMFYITKFMQKNVYRIPRENAYVIAEESEGELILYQIFSPAMVDPETVAEAFGSEIQRLSLRFVPWKDMGYMKELRRQEDTTLFVKGECFVDFEKEQLCFPELAHA